MAEQPAAIVLAGINGAGKTSASRSILKDTLHLLKFVNADAIAQGLSAFDPESVAIKAGRIMLEELRTLATQRADFAFETTLAARTYAGWLASIKSTGYEVHLLYFWLKSPDLAISRVANRVKAGGHHVPDGTIRQRYSRSLRNFFELYRPLATTWKVYDNSSSQYRLIAEGHEGADEAIHDSDLWEAVKKGQTDG